MADLHERLTAVVRERLALAREATPGPWLICLRTSEPYAFVHNTPLGGGRPANPIVGRHNGGTLSDIRYIAANGPDVEIRRCERNLRALGRHYPCIGHGVLFKGRWEIEHPAQCHQCGGVDWPCAEIQDLAYDLGVAVQP